MAKIDFLTRVSNTGAVSSNKLLRSFMARVTDGVAARVQRNVGERLDRVAAKLTADIRRYNENFWSIMVSRVVGALGAPELGDATPYWAPLRQRYVRWKQRNGLLPGHFQATGALKRQLLSLPKFKLFGRPHAETQLRQRGQSSQNVSRNGVAIVPDYIRLYVFRKDLSNLEGIVVRHLGQGSKWKLRPPDGSRVPHRPFINEFARWWVDNYIRRRLKIERTNT